MGEGLSSVEEYCMLPFNIDIIWPLDMAIKLILICTSFVSRSLLSMKLAKVIAMPKPPRKREFQSRRTESPFDGR